MGKGSTRRPLLISETEIENNWNKIFKRKEIPQAPSTEAQPQK
jgi:hypothetical protein